MTSRSDLLAAVLAAAAVLSFGCSERVLPCATGATLSCACGDGGAGERHCDLQGSWTACECVDPDAGVDGGAVSVDAAHRDAGRDAGRGDANTDAHADGGKACGRGPLLWSDIGDLIDVVPGDTSSQLPSLVLDGAGVPIVAFFERLAPSGLADGFVRRWSGSSWEPVGPALDAVAGPLNGFDSPALAVAADGTLYLAWQEPDGPEMFVHVWRWSGTLWEPLGTRLDIVPDEGGASPDLVIDSVGRPVVGWAESGGIYAARWTGVEWGVLGGRLEVVAGGELTSAPRLAVDSSDRPIVIWTEVDETTNRTVHVQRFGASGWEPLASGLLARAGGTATNPDIDVDGDAPTILWRETHAGVSNLHVRRLEGATWAAVGEELTSAVGASAVAQPSIAVRTPEVFVAFETDAQEIVVAVEDGTGWRAVGAPSLRGSHPVIRVDECGAPVLAHEVIAGALAIRVSRAARE